MPDRVEPCLALLKPRVPVGPDWIYEVKWDGYRIAVHLNNGNVRILTRGGHDWTHRFPGIEEAAKRLGGGTTIIDGEAVVLDDEGRPDFGRLQNSLGGRGGKLPAGNAIMFAFDLLYFDGHDIRTMELTARRYFLMSLLQHEEGAIRLSEQIDGDGRDIFEAACAHGLEGIIAKYKDAPYRSGRLGEWIKIKCTQSDSFMVVGYEHSTVARSGIGSLLLAARKGNDWVYVGSVGTGFNERSAEYLRKTLDRLKRKTPPVKYEGRRKNRFLAPFSLISDESVGENNEFSHDCGDGDLWWFPGCDKGVVFGLEVCIEPGCDEGGHVECLAQIGASTANEALALPGSRFTRMRSKACQGGDLSLVERTQFRHFGEYDDGRQCRDAGNRYENVEAGGERLILLDERNRFLIDRLNLAFDQRQSCLVLADDELRALHMAAVLEGGAVGNQALTGIDEFAKALQRCTLLRCRPHVDHGCEAGQQPCIDSVSLGMDPDDVGKAAHLARVGLGIGKPCCRQRHLQLAMVRPGRLEDDALRLMLGQKRHKPAAAGLGIVELNDGDVIRKGEIERLFRDVDTGEKCYRLGHLFLSSACHPGLENPGIRSGHMEKKGVIKL